MKKNILHILIAILIVSHVISFLKINNLQRQIENTNAEMNHLSYSVKENVDTIYSNVDEMLKQKLSLIESATTEIGAINGDEVTVPITFTLTPKEVSQYTSVSLDFDGELFPMEKNGTTFLTTVSRDIFDDALPKIVINESGVKKIIQDDRIGIWSIKESIFPTFVPRFEGEMRHSDNAFRRNGNLSADIKEVVPEIKFTGIRLVIEVDDEVISDETIPYEALSHGYELDEETPISNGQVYTMKVIANNSIGFEHHYIEEHWVLDTNSPEEPYNREPYNQKQYSRELIYSADGELLWGLNYK